TEFDLTAHGPRRVAREDVDLSVRQRVEPLVRLQRHERDLAPIAEHGRRDRPAEIDVEARPGAGACPRGETEQPRVDPAEELAALAYRVERRDGRGLR